jgi:hypothetical protein
MPDYENDIFVSYRRANPVWVRWTRDNFVKALQALLQPALGQLRFFMDDSLEAGIAWPARLGQMLARSRLLVPILCRDYFQSDWCRLELALMHHRERLSGLRTPKNPWGLILPVIIDDGRCFPPEIQEMQGTSIHEYANPYMNPDSFNQEEFARCLKRTICQSIEAALQKVPRFDPGWEEIACEKFQGLFQIRAQSQRTVPPLSLG